jgi:hypothetical protein
VASVPDPIPGNPQRALLHFVEQVDTGIDDGALINVTAPPGSGKGMIVAMVLDALGWRDLPVLDEDAVPREHRILYARQPRPCVWLSAEPFLPGGAVIDPIFGAVRSVPLDPCISRACLLGWSRSHGYADPTGPGIGLTQDDITAAVNRFRRHLRLAGSSAPGPESSRSAEGIGL